VQHLVAILFDRLAADFRSGAGAEPARQLLADLDFDVGLVVEERLSIGVDRDELDSATCSSIMRFRALPPPPPTPTTFIRAFCVTVSSSSKIMVLP